MLRHRSGEPLDRVMCVYHPAPRSYTGEDVVEISCHGNPLIVDEIMQAISLTGLARPADRGEFTRRAFLNSKMNLAQAEAVGALINTGSITGIEMAKSMIQGDTPAEIRQLSEDIFKLISDLEASFIIDETEDDPPPSATVIEPMISRIEGLLEGSDSASTLYTGIHTTIAGLPNAGKSSLFNAIIGYDRAIVHHECGTTRDIIREHVRISGMDFIFHDTAGIRETTASGPEQMGIERTIDALKEAQLVLYVVDASKGLTKEELPLINLGARTIIVMNKADLVTPEESFPSDDKIVWVSAKYKTGLNDLMERMSGLFPVNLPRIFMDRHRDLLRRALICLQECRQSALAMMTADALCLDLKRASAALQEITGENSDKDILDRVFSDFCVGK